MSNSFSSSTDRVEIGRLPDGTRALFVDGVCVHCSGDLDVFRERFPEPHGKILMGGLGLGLDTLYLLTFPEVEKLVVVEIEPDIISLFHTRHPVQDSRLEIVKGDFFQRYSQYLGQFDMIINTVGTIEEL